MNTSQKVNEEAQFLTLTGKVQYAFMLACMIISLWWDIIEQENTINGNQYLDENPYSFDCMERDRERFNLEEEYDACILLIQEIERFASNHQVFLEQEGTMWSLNPKASLKKYSPPLKNSEISRHSPHKKIQLLQQQLKDILKLKQLDETYKRLHRLLPLRQEKYEEYKELYEEYRERMVIWRKDIFSTFDLRLTDQRLKLLRLLQIKRETGEKILQNYQERLEEALF